MNHKLKILLLTVLFPFVGLAQIDSVLSIQKINNVVGGLTGSPLGPADRFGAAVEVIGDVDHDGIDDIAVGAYLDDDGKASQGAIYILMLNADGTVKDQQKISATAGNGPSFYGTHYYFGSDIAALGDINGDGNVDIAVGAYGCGDEGVSGYRGAVYILFLEDDGTVLEYQKISDHEGGGPGNLVNYDYFGVNVSNIGDLNGDGLPDLAIHSSGNDNGGTNVGAVYIGFLDVNGTLKEIQKISATSGGFSDTLTAGDGFGNTTSMGDMDGDGIIDLAVGAYLDDDGGTDRGAVWILFMNSDGTVKSSQKISDTIGGFTGVIDDSDNFGNSLVNISDLDGDGIDELAVGALKDDDETANSGAFWILYMNSDGTVKGYTKISSSDTKLYDEVEIGNRFGGDLAYFGDRNNDGKIDLLVGAWNAYDSTSTLTGEIYILHMEGTATYPHKEYFNALPIVKTVQKYSDTTGEPLENELDASDLYGISVTNIGDLDGDGINDVAVGASLDDDGYTNAGAVYIQFLNANGSIKSYQKISKTEGSFGEGPGGKALTNMGDLDGDGVTDIAIGYSAAVSNTGLVWITFLDSNGTVQAKQKIDETNGGFSGDLDAGDMFGYSVANIGDVDGDGISDLAVGALRDDDGGTNKGAVWILFLDSNGTVQSEQKISDTEGNFSGNLDSGDAFGYSLANIGDMDGDGINELAVGVQKDDDGGSDAGAVYVLYLTDSGTVASSFKISESTTGFEANLYNFTYFGASVVGGYDLDFDGVNDFLVGARDLNDGGKDRGGIFMLLMNPDNTIKSHKNIGSTTSQLTGLIDNVDYFGCSMTMVDYDVENSIAKIAVGAYNDDDGATNSGAAYLLEIDLLSFMKKGASFIKPKVKLDAGYYNIPSNNKVRIQFNEEYYASGDLNFTVYDSSNGVKTTTQSFAARIGDSRYMIDFDLFSGITTGYYTLKITNSKNENRFLRLKKQ